MGKLFDEFGGLTFRNEAEVSQNFITPLLENYLGYDLREIVPEKHYPARDLFSGVNFSAGGSKGLTHRPDFVICLDGDTNDAKFIIDSKGPDEDIDDHSGQLRSYANSVGKNFLMMTNGKELKVYDVNNLIFHSVGMDGLQLKIDHLVALLGRTNQQIKSPIDILKEFNYEQAVGRSDQDKLNQEILKNRVLLCDFDTYLTNVRTVFTSWHLPTSNFQAINNLDIKKIDPNHLLSFKQHPTSQEQFRDEKILKFSQIESEYHIRKRIIVGETGTGKTSLLKYLTYRAAQHCLNFKEVKIPVYISLREVGHSYTLENLIVSFLNRHGYSCTSFFNLPGDNDFVFFLDAYDEIGEIFRRDVFQAIENLSQKYECFLTTRPNVVPQFTLSSTFDLLPLSEIQIGNISRHYIDLEYYEFQRQIENNNLQNEAGNTLLLLFLISLFKESGTLPETVSKIITGIVHRVKLWQDEKANQPKNINWDALAALFSVIAFKIFESAETTLTLAEAEPLILNTLLELEDRRKIPIGLTTNQVINALTETGLLIVNNDHLYFWHRLFLNHFAAIGLKEKYSTDKSVLDQLKHDEKWGIAIIGMSSLLPDITAIAKQLKDNLWLSAYCLLENSNCETDATKNIIDELIKRVDSPIPDIRRKGASYLDRIDNQQTRHFFLDVFSSDHYSDITMMALSAVGKTKTAEARKIIYEHLDWNESSFLMGPSSQAYIVRALSYFDEPEHLQIIENWKKTQDYQTDEECKRIFLEFYSKNKLTDNLIKKLKEFYVSEYKAESNGSDKIAIVGKILALVPDDDFAREIIELPFQHEELSKMDSLYSILKANKSLHIIELVKNKIFEKADSNYAVEKLADAINDSACAVPKEIFYELIDHPNVNVASTGLNGLSRFEYNDVKDVIRKHLDGDNPQLQSWALRLTVENAEIVRLIRNQEFPKSFFAPTVHTLLKAVRRFHLIEALPLLQKVYNALSENKRYEYETHLAFDLAGTYYFMGEKDMQANIVKWFFDGTDFLQKEKHFHNNLMKSLKYFDHVLAASVANCFYVTHFPPKTEKFRYETEVFIETAEELAESSLKEHVKEIAEYFMERIKANDTDAKHQLERPMRALVKIGQPSDENWLLGHLEDFNYESGFEFSQLRRAMECLAYIGSAKSLPIIRKVAQQRKSNEMLINVCQLAYSNICRRENILMQDDALFNLQ